MPFSSRRPIVSGSTGGPRLRAQRSRIFDGEARPAPTVAGEYFGKPVAEVSRRLECRVRDRRRFRAEAVAGEAGGDQGVVVRPDGSVVVADRVVAAFAFGHRADPPARVEPFAGQMGRKLPGAVRGDDPAPE